MLTFIVVITTGMLILVGIAAGIVIKLIRNNLDYIDNKGTMNKGGINVK